MATWSAHGSSTVLCPLNAGHSREPTYTPLRQFAPGDIHVLCYEHLCVDRGQDGLRLPGEQLLVALERPVHCVLKPRGLGPPTGAVVQH